MSYHRTISIAFSLVAAALAPAATTLTTQAYCNVDVVIVATGDSACSLSVPAYYAHSSATAVGMTSIQGNELRIELQATAESDGVYSTSTGLGVVTLGETVHEVGPVRMGIVTGTITGYRAPVYNANGLTTLDSDQAIFGTKVGNGVVGPATVMLGSPLTISAYAYAVEYEGKGHAGTTNLDLLVDLLFFEADGKTAVALSEVPEPGLLGLFGIGATVLISATVRPNARD